MQQIFIILTVVPDTFLRKAVSRGILGQIECPDINGWIYVASEWGSADGSLFTVANYGNRNSGLDSSGKKYTLKASGYNSIYGRSTTNQPPAINALIIIKI